ncbi:MAG: DsbA family protein [Thermomicrobiales bacterium]|nr:DsbA family protein [Thermomicrobiales bacterium]
MSEPEKVQVYFDYACPFADSAVRWANELKQQIGDEVTFEFKFFPLEQVNAPADVEEAIWDLPRENRSPARHSMQAGAAALQQGSDVFDAFNLELMKLKHAEGKDHGKRATILEAAERAGLNLTQFAEDLEDDDLLDIVREHYEQGVGDFGVFGTPTFVFPSGAAVYLQVLPPPTAEEAVPLWREFAATANERPSYREFKRTRRPAQ